MIGHLEKRVAFVEHPKAAGRSVSEYLRTKLDFVQITDHHEGPSGRRTNKGIGDNYQRFLDSGPNGWSYIYIVRSHFDAWASWWEDNANKIRHPKLCPEFVEEFELLHPGIFRLPGRLWYFAWDPVFSVRGVAVRYECLTRSLTEALYQVGIPKTALDLPHTGKTEGRRLRWQDYYEPEMYAWLWHRYQSEVDRFGYGP